MGRRWYPGKYDKAKAADDDDSRSVASTTTTAPSSAGTVLSSVASSFEHVELESSAGATSFEHVECESSAEAEPEADVCVSLVVAPVAPPPPPPPLPSYGNYADLRRRLWAQQIRAFLELNQKAGGHLSGITPEAYFAEFGFITEEAPWGTHVRVALQARFQAGQYRYDYQLRNADAWGVGYFLAPGDFSAQNAEGPPVAGDSIWYPTLWFRFGMIVWIGCLVIIIKGSKVWIVHVYCVHNIAAVYGLWFD